MAKDNRPFWERKTLSEMTTDEWESLCDGCARCCVLKYRDEETDEVYYSNVACRLLDLETCRCRHYADRRVRMPDCTQLSPDSPDDLEWLPLTCAYRRIANGQELPAWHPLLTGDPHSTMSAGMSARGHLISEDDAGEQEIHLTPES